MYGTVCDKSTVAEMCRLVDSQRKVEDVVAWDVTSTVLCSETGMQAKTVSGALEKLVYLELVAKVQSRRYVLLNPNNGNNFNL